MWAKSENMHGIHDVLYDYAGRDGKAGNPFTGTEVWAVAGRRSKPLANEVPTDAKRLDAHSPEDYCSFCPPRYSKPLRRSHG